jgi:hypothetical protein
MIKQMNRTIAILLVFSFLISVTATVVSAAGAIDSRSHPSGNSTVLNNVQTGNNINQVKYTNDQIKSTENIVKPTAINIIPTSNIITTNNQVKFIDNKMKPIESQIKSIANQVKASDIHVNLNKNNFDMNGFDRNGFDRKGYNRNGFDKHHHKKICGHLVIKKIKHTIYKNHHKYVWYSYKKIWIPCHHKM